MTELVSILIPAFKAERFIAETVRNALAQSWPRKEIIVVDDGSPDRTYEIANQFASPCVKVIRQENGGAPSARNTAFELAQGEYIQWLDADDLLHPDKIRHQLDGAESGLTSKVLLTGSWGRFYHRPDRAVFKPDSLWRDLSPLDWMLSKFLYNAWMNPTVWLVSRRLTEMAGPWDSRLARSGDDDSEYVCRIVAQSSGIRFIDKACAYYRVGNFGSLSWGTAADNDSLMALVYSLEEKVHLLLKLEDSARTRQAAFVYLSTFAQNHFYGSDHGCFAALAKLAEEIGFDLPTPRTSWKYRPMEILVGPRITRDAIVTWRRIKERVCRRLEQQLGLRAAS